MDTFYAEQLKPDFSPEAVKYIEVIDRTTGQVCDEWSIDEENGNVIIQNAKPFHHVSCGWDNNPRFKNFRAGIVKNNTPQNVQKAMQMAKEYLDKHQEIPPLVTINSWNEWTETSYLQPDNVYGYGYLEAIKNVFKD